MLAQSAGIASNSGADAGAEPDAEVSFFTRDLTTVLPRAKLAAAAPLDEILARVREAANWDGGVGQKPLITDSMPISAYAPERQGDPYSGFQPRIVPENVTLLPKTTAQITGGNAWNERTFVLRYCSLIALPPVTHPGTDPGLQRTTAKARPALPVPSPRASPPPQ